VKVIMGIALFFNFAYQLSNSFSLYYFSYAIGIEGLYPVYTGVAGVAQMAAQFTFPMITKIIGRGKAFFAACFLPVLGFAMLFVVGIVAPSSAAAVVASSAVVNYGIGFMLVFITVMLADVVDYGEYALGTRNESILFSMQTFIVKFAGAFSGLVSGVGLTVIGWKAGEVAGAGTIAGMKVIMILIPAILSALCFVFYKKGYKLTGEFYENMIRELRARKE
jgi:melibiose permease